MKTEIIEENILKKIEKCLALGQSANENEADAAMKMAHAMLLRYNLSLEDVKGQENGVQETICFSTKNAKDWEKLLGNGVAIGNYCNMLVVENFVTADNGERTVSGHKFLYVGRPGNVKTAKHMFDYLHEVVMNHAKQVKNKADFKQGMAVGLAHRLSDIRFEQEAEAMFAENRDCGEERALIVLNLGTIIARENRSFVEKKYSAVENEVLDNTGAKDNDYYRGLRASNNVGLNQQIN